MSMKSEQPVRRLRLRRFRPTDRDLDLVRYTWEAGLATREHLQRLYFSDANRSRAQTRIKLLRDAGYLEQLPGRLPNEPAVYVVSRRAVQLLGLGSTADGPRMGQVSYARLEHSLAIADCRVQALLASRGTGLQVLRWLNEEELRPVTTTSGVLPDAYFQLEREVDGEPRKSGFFLEVERTEKSERALRQKLYGLGTYYYGGGYERDFATRALRILVLVHPEPGASGERLVRKVAGLGRIMGITLLRVAELEAFRATPPADLFFRAIWHQPGSAEPTSLFEKGESADDHQQAA